MNKTYSNWQYSYFVKVWPGDGDGAAEGDSQKGTPGGPLQQNGSAQVASRTSDCDTSHSEKQNRCGALRYLQQVSLRHEE
jgi:hypothetical protein